MASMVVSARTLRAGISGLSDAVLLCATAPVLFPFNLN